jgi:hypothetical protein
MSNKSNKDINVKQFTVVDTTDGWFEIHTNLSTPHIFTSPTLSLRDGAKYITRVGAVNAAGTLSIEDTNGVRVDSSKPRVGITAWMADHG